jgi:hypothetical protein
MTPAFERSTGRVTVGEVEVSPEANGPLVRNPLAASSVTVAYRSDEITAYRIAPTPDDEYTVGVMAYCDSSRTLSATIVVATGDDMEGLELSRDVRQRMKERHDRLLRDQLGSPPYRYDWGAIESVDDPRGLHPSIVIRYGH